MKRQTICILVCTLLITMIATPIMGIPINSTNTPYPGCIDVEDFILKETYSVQITTPLETTVSYNEDLVALFQQLDEDIYLGYLENLTAFGPRVTGTSECDDAGDYIYSVFDGLGLDVRYQWWDDNGLTAFNVEATYYGENPQNDEIYIICGHYDSVEDSPGADDDGSGTVAAMAAANVMRNAEFNQTIRFVAFSGEEQGLLGSYYYVQEAVQNGDNIMAVLNLDMIGYVGSADEDSKMRVFDEEEISGWLTDFIGSMADEYYDILGLEVEPSGTSYGSDHVYFLQAGYSAIFGHEYDFNPYWHTPGDTIENMDISYAIRNTQLNIATLAELTGFITLNAPYIPEIPAGPIKGVPDELLTYTTTTTDPQDDEIYYLFDWGDGTDTGWLGPYTSGIEVGASHTWEKQNDFQVKAKAKDTDGYESEWSNYLVVTIPRSRTISESLFMRLLERFPNAFPIMRQLLGL